MTKHTSRIYISQSALKSNITYLRKKIGPEVKLSAVVKANAYGHGIPVMTKALERCGVDHFSVASAFEAEEVLKHSSEGSQVMIMGILYDEDLGWAIENEVEFYVFDYDRLDKVKAIAKEVGKKARIHIELETGTNRTGMNWPDFKKSLTWIKRNKSFIEFEGVCTHLGGAESLANEFKIKPQMNRFFNALKELKKKNCVPKYRHMACSSAAIAYAESRLDMVRIGVSIYGFWSSPDIYYSHIQAHGNKNVGLKRIITWKTDVMDIKNVKEGEFIGYGTAYQALKDMKIAVIPLGYSNGYPRGLSNKGFVLIHGKKAPIVGLVNMNLFMVDISHLSNVATGDEVVLLGKQKNNVITVSSFTNFTHLLNNEMLSRLPAGIPRQIVK